MLLMVLCAGINVYGIYVVCYTEEPPLVIASGHPDATAASPVDGRGGDCHFFLLHASMSLFPSPRPSTRFRLRPQRGAAAYTGTIIYFLRWFDRSILYHRTQPCLSSWWRRLWNIESLSLFLSLSLSLTKASCSTKTTVASIMQANGTSGSRSFRVP